MDTFEWPCDLAFCKLKTARQKRRLAKKDFDKRLLAIDKHRNALYLRRRNLPMVQLKEPYQKGWKRFFVLREDVARSGQADYYLALLEKINTTQYSNNQTFTSKARRRRMKIRVGIQQQVKAFTREEWNSPKLKLTESEKQHFHAEDRWNRNTNRFELWFVFSEPWRYVPKIKPHMITEVRMVDEELEQELDMIDNMIAQNNWQPKISKLTTGGSHWYRWDKDEKPEFVALLKNKPLHKVLAEVEEDKINDNEQFKN